MAGPLAVKTAGSSWETGRPWAERWLHHRGPAADQVLKNAYQVRELMRPNKGLRTRWTANGLEINCNGQLKTEISKITKALETQFGKFQPAASGTIQLATVGLWSTAGQPLKWKPFNEVTKRARSKRLEDIATIIANADDMTTIKPKPHVNVSTSKSAYRFEQLCLNIVAPHPEIISHQRLDHVVRVHHPMDDPHHVFEVEQEATGVLKHSWASVSSELDMRNAGMGPQQAAAELLDVPAASIWVVPHPWLTHIRALWAGKRSWTIKRSQLKKMIANERDSTATKLLTGLQEEWRKSNERISTALDQLEWTRIGRMEGVTPYHTQNIRDLKLHRFSLGGGRENGYRCTSAECVDADSERAGHMAWACPVAQTIWTAWLAWWGRQRSRGEDDTSIQHDELIGIFTFRLSRLPQWLSKWGQDAGIEQWGLLDKTGGDLWAIGCAVTLTAIWRWHVDRIYDTNNTNNSIAGHAGVVRKMITEAFERYRLSLYPLNQQSKPCLEITHEILRRWKSESPQVTVVEMDEVGRVDLFYGGSRGNPGAGGSGSVIVELNSTDRDCKIMWAATTALGEKETTNNVAEFIGLHRILTKAAESQWTGLHIVGDSMFILGMMQRRKPPKAKGLQHWYMVSCRAADLCEIRSWSHHYRRHNKMADWLANMAMDKCQSRMWTAELGSDHYNIKGGLEELCTSNVRRWVDHLSGREKAED